MRDSRNSYPYQRIYVPNTEFCETRVIPRPGRGSEFTQPMAHSFAELCSHLSTEETSSEFKTSMLRLKRIVTTQFRGRTQQNLNSCFMEWHLNKQVASRPHLTHQNGHLRVRSSPHLATNKCKYCGSISVAFICKFA